jgi:hypothetical protein
VRLDGVLTGFDFVEVLLAADRPRRMADIARAAVPVLSNLIDRYPFERQLDHLLDC